MNILVTGGAGYIGSHTLIELIEAGYTPVVVDNLSNSSPEALKRVEKITGAKIPFHKLDLRNEEELEKVFAAHKFDAIIHFAGLKAVGESVAKPLHYYNNNLTSTLTLLQQVVEHKVPKFIFSSSATVYGDPASVPIREDFPLSATNPYGRSKLMIEDALRDTARSDPTWNIALLRYFNPVGAHGSGLIGEDPNGLPNNLMPFITQVAIGLREKLSVFGDDYPTPDGTGVRDYIHVVDLARGHLAALKALSGRTGVLTVNLGTGQGYSVLDVIHAFERASGRPVPYQCIARRPGDIAQCYADPAMALDVLGWRAERGLDDMCRDSWRWQQWASENLT